MPTFTSRIAKQWIMRVVQVPARVVEELGGWQTLGAGGKGIPVVARYCDEALVTTVVPGGGKQGRLTVRLDVLKPFKLDVGDALKVTLTRSTAPQEPDMPEDLRRALQSHPLARAYFERMTPSSRRYVVRHLDEARRPETRANRIEYFMDRFSERGK